MGGVARNKPCSWGLRSIGNAQTSMIYSLLKLSKLARLACILSRDQIMTKNKTMRRLVCAFDVTGLFVMGPYHCTGGGCSMGHILTYNSFFKMEINYNGQHVALPLS